MDRFGNPREARYVFTKLPRLMYQSLWQNFGRIVRHSSMLEANGVRQHNINSVVMILSSQAQFGSALQLTRDTSTGRVDLSVDGKIIMRGLDFESISNLTEDGGLVTERSGPTAFENKVMVIFEGFEVQTADMKMEL